MAASPKGVTVLGATGTIGVNTLDVMARHPQLYRAVALTANGNVERLVEQCRAHRPAYAVVADPEQEGALAAGLKAAGLDTEALAGPEALAHVAALPETDYVMAAIVGGAGLLPSLAAARAGKRVLLANKEALVMSGRIFMDQIRQSGAELLPIDSEHNAIFQCMPGDFDRGLGRVGVERILLTASGGPFRAYAASDLEAVTPEQACAHPNWVMGRKISVDSASMMNKGLELIEACWLFDTKPDKVEVVLHPQSVIHSMVSYVDGSVLAQLGNPDMRTPIAHALAWPERIASGVDPLDIVQVARLDFERPDMDRFPCLRLAYESFEAGGTATAILNAANEVAVESFLEARIRFTDIPRVISHCLETMELGTADTLEEVLAADEAARAVARAVVTAGGLGRRVTA
ncbi:1-deoxy-D-xylulose-5-phosphate reductoisomerase [Ectothiorhodospira haloalkaliphila]|uniref:1-deoxy-D-xylulose-5-phosphate reductoisomerase n=1 Tax=Ectothiorhodospira haloalkaliphila TaxID=421628 RepID=UPI001EE9438C|nr:1-deoxy-D-xylulose-5-phosphate reductoisomerase [Ectothiorhodospira haloalkaliphila]MCG5524690.1 1-deoxy-D-xylulose-5-phosphate reductoisomerase [Ectothiorhodospira haloalkaliphila]